MQIGATAGCGVVHHTQHTSPFHHQALHDSSKHGGWEQERLDPIDWAMYEPFLWANATALQQRLGVLFGALLRLHQPASEVSLPPHDWAQQPPLAAQISDSVCVSW